jgi:hypothetical protein
MENVHYHKQNIYTEKNGVIKVGKHIMGAITQCKRKNHTEIFKIDRKQYYKVDEAKKAVF